MGEIESYAEKLRAAGGDTAKVNSRLLSLIAKADAAQAVSNSAAVPGDKFDDSFRVGPEGFTASMESIKQATKNMAGSFDEMSRGQFDAATTVEHNEDASEEGFRNLQA